jgi:hypothetical protein
VLVFERLDKIILRSFSFRRFLKGNFLHLLPFAAIVQDNKLLKTPINETVKVPMDNFVKPLENQHNCSALAPYWYWCQFLRSTVPAHKIAKELGEARAREPVRDQHSSLAILCAGTVDLRN